MKIQGIFSVVMAVRNGGATLTRALDSLMSQTCGEWECLIQDGMSDDNTEELLAARQDKRLKVAREADSGVYDAWNQGPRAAFPGELLGHVSWCGRRSG